MPPLIIYNRIIIAQIPPFFYNQKKISEKSEIFTSFENKTGTLRCMLHQPLLLSMISRTVITRCAAVTRINGREVAAMRRPRSC